MVGSFFFQAEDGIRDLVRSRGLGDVYKRQLPERVGAVPGYCQRYAAKDSLLSVMGSALPSHIANGIEGRTNQLHPLDCQ